MECQLEVKLDVRFFCNFPKRLHLAHSSSRTFPVVTANLTLREQRFIKLQLNTIVEMLVQCF